MNGIKRFCIGGLGALMPILVTFIALDITLFVSNVQSMSVANMVGFGLRYAVLFLIGGFVAWLHADEKKPYKVFEFGIAAPALISSFITAQGVNPENAPAPEPPDSTSITSFFIPDAHAVEPASEPAPKSKSFLKDVWSSASGNIYKEQQQMQKAYPVEEAELPPAAAEPEPEPIPEAAAPLAPAGAVPADVGSGDIYRELANATREAEELKRRLGDLQTEYQALVAKVQDLDVQIAVARTRLDESAK